MRRKSLMVTERPNFGFNTKTKLTYSGHSLEGKELVIVHLGASYDMREYLAAAGNNLYTKSIHLHLQIKLPTDHPEVYQAFVKRFHMIRHSDRILGRTFN